MSIEYPTAARELAGRIETIKREIARRKEEVEHFRNSGDLAAKEAAHLTALLDQYTALLKLAEPKPKITVQIDGNLAPYRDEISARRIPRGI